MGQYKKAGIIKEGKDAVGVRTQTHSTLPYFLSPAQLLQILGGDPVQVFYEPEDLGYLLGVLGRQPIEKLLDRASPVLCSVESDSATHGSC